MDGADDDRRRASPSNGTLAPADTTPWRFHDARGGVTPEPADRADRTDRADRADMAERAERAEAGPRLPRPQPARRRSLPQVLVAPGAPSVFGSGPAGEATTRAGNTDAHVRAAQPQLSTLVRPSASDARLAEQARAAVDRRIIPGAEKDADDPTTPPTSARNSMDRRPSTTLTTLSRLFAVQASVSDESPRRPSDIYPQRIPPAHARSVPAADPAPLPHHLYARGLLEGRHSDITVHAFGHPYRLHCIVLDRAPFFSSALSAPWREAHASEITVHPEDIDASITQHSFELALKRLYGCSDLHEEDGDAVGLFATGCWLEMQDLIDSSIESILRQMTPETLSPLIKLVTSNYYGRAGEKILASAKAMLCRDGWHMPIRHWDGIPGDMIREIVAGDGFFIDGEWDRWVLAKRLLDRRLKKRALEAGLFEPGSRRKIRKAPDAANLLAVRFDGIYRTTGVGRGMPDALHQYVSLYTHPDVEPILVLLDEGIHYIHLDFEQLQFIRRARDILGLPLMPDKVISTALWQQMELRQRVVNARESEVELDLSVKCTDDSATLGASRDATASIRSPLSSPPPPSADKGKHKADDSLDTASEDAGGGSWDGNGQPRKFWIPTSDCNIVMGGTAEPVIATSNNTTLQRHASRLSGTIHPGDIQWASDFTAVTSQPRPPTVIHSTDGTDHMVEAPTDVRYTHFPPFRFAAEFPNPRLLKEKKRVYSRTVFYAGSHWNIYIKKEVTHRSKRLGVYLHRVKEQETDDLFTGTEGLAQGSVDERIGQLEREMILRSERRDRRHEHRDTVGSDGASADGAESSGTAGGDLHGPRNRTGASEGASARSSTMRSLLGRGRGQKVGQTDIAGSSSTTATFTADARNVLSSAPADDDDDDGDDDDNDSEEELETERLDLAGRKFRVPTLPPYVDTRPVIKTYFKIYSPSRGGRMLSIYESAPDHFNFSQSRGWKSSTLMLDEGLLGEDGDEAVPPKDDDPPGEGSRPHTGRTMKGKGDGKLRFMVVIGNI